MTELTVFQHDAVDVVDSRQVAEMIGKRHDHLLRDIQGYCDILSKTTDPKIGGSDFFIESSYKDSTGRTLPCYLLTKKGCWTQKGRMMIHNILTKRGIVALMDREEA